MKLVNLTKRGEREARAWLGLGLRLANPNLVNLTKRGERVARANPNPTPYP